MATSESGSSARQRPRALPVLSAEVVELDLLTGQSVAIVALSDKTARVINLADDTLVAQYPPCRLRFASGACTEQCLGCPGR